MGQTRQLAESVDIFPTLAESAGFDSRGALRQSMPVSSTLAPGAIHDIVPQPIDGRSLVPVLRDPSARVRDHAYHVFPKAKLGRAIRTERYRFVEWRNVGDAPESADYELYDYETDPDETVNLAANMQQVVAELREILAKYPQPVDLFQKPGRQKDLR